MPAWIAMIPPASRMFTDEGPLHGAQMMFFSRNPREHHQVVLVAGRPPGHGDKVINQLSFRVGR